MPPTMLGSYPVEREVGRGGMGIVYLARDPRLDRPVAIKVLPDEFAQDPDRLARFEREARLLASLSHPNIAAIYGLEQADGKRFLVLEYVEGDTLAQRLARGPIPVDETLDLGRQIASALETAHESGIVHRDLKPGNVKLSPGGEVKVLDFGLAKSAGTSSDSAVDLTHSPTMTQAATGLGVILGTAAYMSPEQARGRPVDRRTDIWSFGCVLFECLTGAQAFEGETVSDVIAMILQGEPDWSKLPAKTPEKLRLLLRRCLERDPKRRLRDMGDARLELEELEGVRTSSSRLPGPADPAAAGPTRAPRWRTMLLALAILLLGAAGGIGIWNRAGTGSRTAAPLRFVIDSPPQAEIQADPAQSAISPDGTMLAFVATDSAGLASLWIRDLGRFVARPLPGTRNAFLPFWSPDSRQVGYFAEGKLWRIRERNGRPEVICNAASGRGGSWNRNGVIVFGGAATGPLMQVRASGGQVASVTVVDTAEGEQGHRFPCFLPDGQHFLYASVPVKDGQFQAYIGSLRSTKRVPLLTARSAPLYAAPGHVIFTRNDALMAQRFDPGRRSLIGEPFRIGDPPGQTPFSGSPSASVSTNGILAWQNAGLQNSSIVWLDRTGREVGTLGMPLDRWVIPVPSDDGKRILVEQLVGNGTSDLWVVDVERHVSSRLTFGQGFNEAGAWSPDLREVAYASNRGGPRAIHVRAADGSGADRLVPTSAAPFKTVFDWSPDGKTIVYAENGDANGWNIMTVPAAGGTPRAFLATPFDEQFPFVSPDGKWILYSSDESGVTQVYVQSFPEPGSKQQVSRSGAYLANWVPGGQEILMLRNDLMFVSVALEPGPVPRFGAERELFRVPQGVRVLTASDGRRFVAAKPAGESRAQISVAVGWLSGREE